MPAAPSNDKAFDDAPSTRQVEDWIHPHRKALAALMHSEELRRGDVAGALELVTEVASRILRVERASVWRFSDDRLALDCGNLFERTQGVHTKGGSLLSAAYPSYFRALAEERSIAAVDAHTDPRTCEFSESYLRPNGIGAMLDAPVFVRGTMVGVVCHEHVGGPRRWLDWEELVAGSIADFVALALEGAERNLAEKRLQEHQQHLEALVSARTAELTLANEKLAREIVERKRTEVLLRNSGDNLKTLFEVSPSVLVLSRLSDERIVLANRQASELFVIPEVEMAEHSHGDFYVEPSVRKELVGRVLREGHVGGFEVQLKTRAGREFPALISAQKLIYDGEPALLFSVVDITEQKATEARLRELATIDALTGCYNRQQFFELGAQEFERATRYQRSVCVAMLDVDHFKRVNDTFGHDVGDRVLRQLTDVCRRALRRTDIFGRLGGEEFSIVFLEIALGEACSIARRLLSNVEASAVTHEGVPIVTTLSAGVVERRHAESFEAALKRADDALYRAKAAGRNQVAVG